MFRSRWLRAYVAGGGLLAGLYGFAEWTWWEKAPEVVAHMDPSVRQSPGGWRTWTFWHRGYRGGK